MKNVRILVLPLILLALPPFALGDPWKDESGKRHQRREHKEEYRDGNCKVERKWEKNGEYKEERKCKGPRRGHYQHEPAYAPGPSPIIIEPGITINGTIIVPQ